MNKSLNNQRIAQALRESEGTLTQAAFREAGISQYTVVFKWLDGLRITNRKPEHFGSRPIRQLVVSLDYAIERVLASEFAPPTLVSTRKQSKAQRADRRRFQEQFKCLHDPQDLFAGGTFTRPDIYTPNLGIASWLVDGMLFLRQINGILQDVERVIRPQLVVIASAEEYSESLNPYRPARLCRRCGSLIYAERDCVDGLCWQCRQ